jgi:hypothetical protein
LESGTGYPFSSFPSEFCIKLFWRGEWFPSLFRLPIAPLGAVSVPGLCVLIYNSKTSKAKKERKRKNKERTKEINRVKWWTNKHIKKNSRFRNNRISVLVVLVLLFQHPVLVLVFKQKLCLSLARWLGKTHQFFSCLSAAAA